MLQAWTKVRACAFLNGKIDGRKSALDRAMKLEQSKGKMRLKSQKKRIKPNLKCYKPGRKFGLVRFLNGKIDGRKCALDLAMKLEQSSSKMRLKSHKKRIKPNRKMLQA
jgi:hypothetical protein